MATHDDPVTRKVQLTGGSTYTVSLPKEWANARGIDVGSTVRLYPREDRLLVTTEKSVVERRTARVDARSHDPTDLSRTIEAAYVAGCDEIRIEGIPNKTKRRSIRDAVAGLVGIELYSESNDTMVARTMLDTEDLSPEQTLIQMELTALAMHESAVGAVLDSDREAARQVIRQDDDVDRLFGLICRGLHRSLVNAALSEDDTALTTFDYYTCARQIERVADHAENIAAAAGRIDSKPPAEIGDKLVTLAERSRRIVRRARTGLLDDDPPEDLGAIIADAEEFVEETESLDEQLYDSDHDEAYLLGTVLDSIIRTAEYGINIAEAGLQATMREPDENADAS